MSILIILTAAWGAGSALLAPVRSPDPLERLCFTLLAGLAPVAVVALVVGSYSLAAAQYFLLAAAFCAVVYALRRARDTNATRQLAWSVRDLCWLERGAMAALMIAWLLSLVGAVAPVTGWDATVAHLALPSDYAREGRIYLHSGNVYSGYPQFVHALYAVAYYDGAGGREILVSLLNWFFGVLACLAIYSLGARVGTRQTGLVAAAILATAPIYMDQAAGVGIDLPFAAFSTCALATLIAWRDERKWGWLALAGLFAGASCGIRHTGFLVCLLLVIGSVLASKPRTMIRVAACFGGAALIAAAPWFVRTWMLLGNPVFPFLLSWFPAAPIDHIAITTPGDHESIARSSGMGLIALLRFPWDIIMRPQLYDGWNKSPGGLVLVLGVPGLLVGGVRAWSLGAFSASGGLVFFFFQRLARYLLPFFTPMMVVAALAAERIPRGRRFVAAVLIFSFAYGLTLHAAAMHFKVKVVLGLETKYDYLASRVERYAAFQYANDKLNDGGTLLMVDQRSYFVNGPTFQNHWSLKRIAGLSLDAQVAWLKAEDIRYVMIPKDFVENSGALSNEIAAMLAEWQRHPSVFERLGNPLIIPRPRGGGVEEVAFYAVR